MIQGAGDVHHLDIGHDFQRAGGGLGQRARLRRGMAVLHHHGGDAESGGGAQDGADIVGIGKLVQHQHNPAALPAGLRSRTSSRSRAGRGAGFQRRALMHRARRQQPGDGLGIRRFDPDPAQQLGTQGFGGPGGQDGPAQLAAGIGQGGLDRMQAIKPVFRLGLPARRFRPGCAGFSGRFCRGLWGSNGGGLLRGSGLGRMAGAYKEVRAAGKAEPRPSGRPEIPAIFSAANRP